MSEVANTTISTMTDLEWTRDTEACNAAMELRTYTVNAAMNLLQIGRTLIEIRPKIKKGEWADFVETNARIGLRTAETYMQAYREFGMDGRVMELGGSQIIKMLPMTPEERTELLTRYDVKDMPVRKLNEAIRQIREEEAEKRREAVAAEQESGRIQLAKAAEQAKLEREKAVQAAEAEAKETVNKAWNDARAKVEEATARANEAEKRAFEAESRPPEIVRETVADPALVEELRKSKEEIERLADVNRTMIESQKAWNLEKAEMQAEIDEGNDVIRQQQEMLNDTKTELLNLKSAKRRGKEPAGTDMTLDTFQRVTREFIGWVSILPQMADAFSRMEEKERRKWVETTETVRNWAGDTLRALNTVNGAEGGFTIE